MCVAYANVTRCGYLLMIQRANLRCYVNLYRDYCEDQRFYFFLSFRLLENGLGVIWGKQSGSIYSSRIFSVYEDVEATIKMDVNLRFYGIDSAEIFISIFSGTKIHTNTSILLWNFKAELKLVTFKSDSTSSSITPSLWGNVLVYRNFYMLQVLSGPLRFRF